MVVRDESGNILDTTKTSTTQLYEHHIYAIDRIRKATVSVKCGQIKMVILLFEIDINIRGLRI